MQWMLEAGIDSAPFCHVPSQTWSTVNHSNQSAQFVRIEISHSVCVICHFNSFVGNLVLSTVKLVSSLCSIMFLMMQGNWEKPTDVKDCAQALQHQHERLNQFEDRLTDIQEKIAPIQLISDTLQSM